MLASMPSSTSWKSTVLKGLTSSTSESGALSKARILFFVPDGDLATNGVYASQVGGLAKYCESLGAKTMIWDKGVTRKMRFFQVPRHFKRLAGQDDRLMDFEPTHIYVRTYASAIAAKELANRTGAKLVYSMRGADVAEALLGRNLRAYIIAAWSWLCVRRAMRLADHVNAVSKTMVEWIWRKFKKRASVLPCCIAQVSGGDLPQRMQRTQGKTIVYSGGMSAWQKIDEIIALMKKISEVDASIRFRFLTKDVDALRQLCASAGLPDSQWSAKSCKPDEVEEELSRADCGIILRDDTLVNQVASPIKVGEYLAAGLGVIASPFIGDVGRDLSGKDFACMVSENTPVERIAKFVSNLNDHHRKAARKWAMEHLTYAGNHSAVMEMFS